jgi:hypothetical protein
MVSGLLVAVALAASPSPAAIAEVKGMLSLIEEAPDYRKIRARPEARAILEAIQADPKVPGPIQERALFALAGFRDDAAFAKLVAVAEDPTAGTFRGEALRALAAHFQDRALPVIERALAGGDSRQLRRMAAMSLKDVGTGQAAGAARNAIAGEADEVVKSDLTRSLRSIESRLQRPTP